MPKFDAAGVSVFALSYDEPEALDDFRAAHNISYTLLSDPQSEVIEEFGILNTLIDPNDHPWFGIPYPGVYVLDKGGAITHKFFDNNLAVRAGPEQLLHAALGRSLPEPSRDAATPDEVVVNIFLDADALASTVQKDLIVQFSIPEGRHVYADPAPAGSVAVDIVLDENDRLVRRPVVRPASRMHTLTSTGESFPVHQGQLELRLPLTLNGGLLNRDHAAEATVSGVVRWQACDDEVCDIPESRRFELTMPVSKPLPVAIGGGKGAELEPNAMAHFKRMSERRLSEQ